MIMRMEIEQFTRRASTNDVKRMSSSTARPRSKLVRSVSNQPPPPFGHAERLSASAREAWASERCNTLADPPLPWTNASRSCQNQCCQQLADRIYELQQEIRGDIHPRRMPSLFSPVTPASNISAGGFSIFPHSRSFSINLASPHASIPTHRYSLSSKMLEQAHRIPERFWMDWQEKQKQHRLGELEAMKNTLSSPVYSFRRPTDLNSSTLNRRKSLRLLHNAQPLRPMMSIDDSPSPPETIEPKLDRTRLSIALPFSLNTTHPPDAVLTREPSLDDVADIDTELNVTFLSQENPSASNLVLYSKALISRSVAFRSLSPRKDDSIS